MRFDILIFVTDFYTGKETNTSVNGRFFEEKVH